MTKKILGWFRCFIKGYCPHCKSKTPVVYECPVCDYDTSVPTNDKVKKNLWWSRYGDYKDQLSVYIAIQRRMERKLPNIMLYYAVDHKVEGTVIYRHPFDLTESDDKVVKNMMIVTASKNFKCWIASERGGMYLNLNEELLRKKFGKDYDVLYKQAFGKVT